VTARPRPPVPPVIRATLLEKLLAMGSPLLLVFFLQ
jgi:hypothetical protein